MEHLTDKIQEYIEGQLRGEELAAFENHLQHDEEFRNLVKLQQEIHEILHNRLNSGESDLRQTLFHAENQTRSSQRTLFNRIKPIIGVASAACVLIIGYLFLFNPASDLYDLPTMQSEIVRGQESNEQYEEAVKLYNHKSYFESRELLNRLLEKEPDVVQYQYYAALTYLGEENWSKATDELRKIADGQSIFNNEAKYYLAVSLDKQGMKAEAISVLKTIPNQGELGKKVEKLIDKLD